VNVLYINHTVKKSGAGISLGTLIRHLPAAVRPHYLLRQGSEVDDILGVGDRPAVHARFISQTMTTMYGRGLPFPQFAWQIIKSPYCASRAATLCEKWKIDIAHINETTLLADARGAAGFGIPVFVHARTACQLRPFERRCLEATGRLANVRFIAIDDEVKDSLPGACREKCTVVHNPIDLGPQPRAEAVSSLRAAWGCGPDSVIVGQAASLHKEKGVWEILDIADSTRESLPDVRFVFVGDKAPGAGLGPELEQAVRERSLAGRVVFAGYQSDLALVYGAFDVALCLFGGGLGGVGRAAFEAGLAAKPLVATLPDPKNSSTLQDGVSGMLFAPDDHAGIRAGIERLCGDPGLRASMGASARAVLAPRHDPRQVAAKVFGLYEDALR